MSSEKYTLGIEEEFQIVDPVTRELQSHIQAIFEEGKLLLKENFKPEMHASVIETGTNICSNIQEARQEVTALRNSLAMLADQHGLRIAAAGTHPFSDWREQKITDHPRYVEIINEMQETARANLIFGMHVHVGIANREIGIQIMNAARYFLPHIFALSTNSPFWLGRNTGFKSYRVKVFDKFPRTGIPDYFISLAEYDSFINLLIKTNCIDNAKKIWWDIRAHPFFNTLEFRICDVQMTINETIALAALIQAVVVKLHKLIQQNLGFRIYERALMMENKWRAARYGIQGKLIDFGKQEEVPFTSLARELLEFIDDVVDELESREEINYIFKMMEKGTGADRQLKVWNESGNDFKKLVDYIIEETNTGIEYKPTIVKKSNENNSNTKQTILK
ncbi:MAG: carboxylate-amine ligase [Ignavibacteria bacterium]|nr:carboxylate-amine ligase [Ignavibacteria bacterium]MBK7254000.1 carboxylate-amine ligase [Ignavibacteria bacterium]MBK8383064.1 carboxylate-amine ligase [Ignavibacteria bacterium]MBK9403921.1 carboxylate-amine ligase [Ignavibacteria bacterium]MBL0108894.1 carboxylate-amine ligase [Ignavibacteria bacterium]